MRDADMCIKRPHMLQIGAHDREPEKETALHDGSPPGTDQALPGAVAEEPEPSGAVDAEEQKQSTFRSTPAATGHEEPVASFSEDEDGHDGGGRDATSAAEPLDNMPAVWSEPRSSWLFFDPTAPWPRTTSPEASTLPHRPNHPTSWLQSRPFPIYGPTSPNRRWPVDIFRDLWVPQPPRYTGYGTRCPSRRYPRYLGSSILSSGRIHDELEGVTFPEADPVSSDSQTAEPTHNSLSPPALTVHNLITNPYALPPGRCAPREDPINADLFQSPWPSCNRLDHSTFYVGPPFPTSTALPPGHWLPHSVPINAQLSPLGTPYNPHSIPTPTPDPALVELYRQQRKT